MKTRLRADSSAFCLQRETVNFGESGGGGMAGEYHRFSGRAEKVF